MGALLSLIIPSGDPLIPEEKMEEYRMLSGFKHKDISRAFISFQKYTEKKDFITKDVFLGIESLVNNPLKERIALCFGFDEEVVQLDFVGYLTGLAQFNSPGKRDVKMKTAFRIQDFDGDGVINKSDLIKYIEIISANGLSTEEMDALAMNVLRESSSDPKQEALNFSDFQHVVAPTDFQAKLLLPL